MPRSTTPEVAPLKPLGDERPAPARAVPRPDARLQGRGAAAARPHARPHADASAASTPPSSAPPRATPARPPSRRCATARPSTSSCCIPQGRVSEVQRRQMTTVLAPNVHNIAIEGTFDDCQDLAKACFNDLAFRDRHALTAVNSINLARVMAQIVYYFWAALKLGAPERPVAFTVPTRQFRQRLCRLRRAADGPADRALRRRRPTATTSWRASSRPARMTIGRRRADLQPQHGHPGLEQLRAPAVRPLRPRRQGAGRGDGGLPQHRHAQGRRQCAGRRARAVRRRPRSTTRARWPPSPTACSATGETLDPHTAVGYAVAQQHRRDRQVPMVVLATAHPAKFPDAVEKATGERPALPPRLADLMERTERVDGLPNDVGALKDMIDERMAARATRSGEARYAHEQRQGHHPRQRPARRGRRDARGRIGLARHLGRLRHAPRDRPSSTAWRTCSSTWPSRARATRSARAIAEEIENVGGSLNAYTGREITAYHASVLKDDVALGVEMVADILRNSVFDPDELQRERGVILQEIGQALDTPDDLIFDQFQETALPGQPLGRPVLGTADVGRGDRPRRSLRLPRAPLHRLQHGPVGGGPRRARPDRRSRREAFRLGAAHARQCRGAGAAAPMSAATAARARVLEQAHLVLGCEGIGYRDPDYFALADLLDPVRRRHVLAPVPAHPRGARPGLRHPLLQHRLCRRRPVRHLCRHRRGRSRRAGAGGVRGVRRRGRHAERGRSWCAPATRSRPAR